MDVSFYGAYGENLIEENCIGRRSQSLEEDLSIVEGDEKFIRFVEEQLVKVNDSEDVSYDPNVIFKILSNFYNCCVDDTHRLIEKTVAPEFSREPYLRLARRQFDVLTKVTNLRELFLE